MLWSFGNCFLLSKSWFSSLRYCFEMVRFACVYISKLPVSCVVWFSCEIIFRPVYQVAYLCICVFRVQKSFERSFHVHAETCSTHENCVLVAYSRLCRFFLYPKSLFLRSICVMKSCGWAPYFYFRVMGQ